jgi:transglutaminase-like putative cysteine protease
VLARLNTLPRDSRDTLFLLLVITWVLLPHVSHLPWWCSALAAGMLLLRGRLAFSGQALPGKWWLLLLLGLAVGATLLTHQTLLGRDAGVTLIVILLALKTLEMRARRDAFVLFFLGFFTMLTHFFYSQSLLTAFSMLLGLLGLLTALVNAHMPVGKPPLRQAAKTAGWMALLGAPVMLVLFMLFPRLAPLWGIPGDAMTGRSGLSASMQVGNIASLALDDSIAMRVKFEGPPPPQRELYFRGPVLTTFDGREWRSLQPRLASGYVRPQGISQLQVFGTPVRYEVTLAPNSRPWILVLDATTSAPVGPALQALGTAELQWIATRPVTDLLRYRAESHVQFRYGPQTSAAALPPQYRELPAGFNPRTLALAEELMRNSPTGPADKAALVQAALKRLQTDGYLYTLEPGVYGQHTADEFWFDRKEGFCEHIASAFVVLMRAMDIPSRIVTGYQGGELNSVDDYWVVRQADAHAWTEVWLAGQGWVRVDPTSAVAPGRTGSFQRLAAPQGLIGQALSGFSPTLAAQFRATWEAVNNRWNQWVLNYTQGKQLQLLKNIGFESPSWEDLGYVLIGLVVLASLAGVAWSLWERVQHDPWLRLLARARQRLGRAGIPSHAATSPRQLALHVLQRHGSRGQDAHDWLMRLETQRYAPAPAAGSLAQLKKQYGQVNWPA